ncbi:MAG TPA: HAD family hydrolase [Erysipelotrichaceae bacterium]|nr:HAD family hydrolase [Erysipelotrichaceae bacterium]
MMNTILFDLDGTLLSMDTDEFIKLYFKAVAVKLKDYFTFEEVSKYFWQSTQYMINNTDPNKTNEEAFFEDFYKHSQGRDKEISDLLDDFYGNEFNEIKHVTSENSNIIKSIQVLKEKGYKLVVATNPLFPKKAILSRIMWAGLDPKDFKLITSFEKMHYTKPHVNYYRQILEKISKDPSECLMVGNDIQEDMVSKEIGIQTYLITDNLIGDINNDENIDHQGDYNDFLNFIENLPTLK